MARALIAVIQSSLDNGEVVNLGSDCSYSVGWLAHTIGDLMGIKDLQIQSDPDRFRRFDIHRFRCDNFRLLRNADWKPAIPIITGLKLTIDWFRSNGAKWCWEDTSNDAIAEVSLFKSSDDH
jgi:nucleoside-diphosphate-sugar epimerase